jgi:hypothetical protein
MNPKPKQKPFFERFQGGKMKKITPAKYEKEEAEMPAKPTFDLEGFAKAEGLDMKELQDFIASKKAPKPTAAPKPMIKDVEVNDSDEYDETDAEIEALEAFGKEQTAKMKKQPSQQTEEVGDIEEDGYPQQLVDFFDMDEDRTWKEFDNNSFKYSTNDLDFTIMAKGKGYKLFIDDANGESLFESEFSPTEVANMKDIMDEFESGNTQQQEVPENFTREEIEELIADSDYNWQMLSVGDNEAYYQTDYQSDTTEYLVDIILKDGEVRFDAYDLLSDEEMPIESSTPISTSKVMNSRELDSYLDMFLTKLK